VILQYIIVSGVITKIEFMRVKTAFSLDKNSYVNNHIDLKFITRLSTSQTDVRQETPFVKRDLRPANDG